MSTKQKNQVKKQTFKIKLLNFIKTFLVFFITVNLLVYLNIFSRSASSGVHVKAKAFMSVAASIERLYIIPLYLTFDEWKTPMAKPFIFIRDEYLKLGNKYLPTDDGESEMWWFSIKYAEFDEVVDPKIDKYRWRIYKKINKDEYYPSKKNKNINVITEEDKQEFNAYNIALDELFNKLEPIATKSIKDPLQAEQRLVKFIAVARSYNGNKGRLLGAHNLKKDQKDYMLINKKEIERISYIFSLYQDLLKNSDKQLNEISKLYNRNLEKTLFEKKFSQYLILSKINNNTLNCNDKLVNYYGRAWDRIIELRSNSPSRYSVGLSLATAISSKEVKISEYCKYNSNLNSLRKRINKIITPERIKHKESVYNNIYKEYMEAKNGNN